MLITHFADQFALAKTERSYNADELVALILATHAPAKDRLPWLKGARFGDVRSERGSLRHDLNVIQITGVEGDYDGGAMAFDAAWERLALIGCEAILYTSPSHTPEKPRWRVLCPLSRPWPPGERARFVSWINGLLGGVLADESFSLSQSYYFGHLDGAAEWRVEHIRGTPLDELEELAQTAIGRRSNGPATGNSPEPSGPFNEAALLDQIVSGAAFHRPAIRLVGKWARDGLAMLEAKFRLEAAFDQIPAAGRDARWKNRRGPDLARVLDDIYGKEAGKAETTSDVNDSKGTKSPEPPPAELPVITVAAGERMRAAHEGLAAMAAGGTPFYRRYLDLVRVAKIAGKDARGQTIHVPAAIPVNPPVLFEALAGAARWQKITKKGMPAKIDPPREIVAHLLGLVDKWPFPPLRGVIATPTLRPDGSLLVAPGYDAATGLYLFDPPTLPAIPAAPNFADADAALCLLSELLEEFCFAEDDGVSRSAAVAMLMTPVLRGAMEVAPMFVITKPEAGTGGSYLQDLAAMIATGERAPVIALSTNAEENEKRLAGAALAQLPVIALDNVSVELTGDFLCQITERPRLRVRRLGASDLIPIDNTFTVFANGNQLTTTGDVVRRVIRIELDANMEDPDRREFQRSPLAEIAADRGRYIAAVLTIARAYGAAGFADELPPRPSYEEWSKFVRSALAWLNWPDPVAGVEQLRSADPVRSSRSIVFEAWLEHLQPVVGYYTHELISTARSADAKPLWDALSEITAHRPGPELDPLRLSKWLNKNLNTVACGHKLVVDRSDRSRPRWKLLPIA